MKKNRKKKNRILAIIENLIIIGGLMFVLYPYVSDWIHQYEVSHTITSYVQEIVNVTNEDTEAEYEEAISYNESVADDFAAGQTLTDEEYEEYLSLLMTGDTEVMGYIQIDKIDCTLPIYHDTEESVLQVAVGHLPWSSLPVGNEGSHTVLSGHTGLTTAKLFTRLDELEIGDTFDVYVLNHKMTYEVDQINVVLPEDLTNLDKEEGKALCTLITCTPYGINTHRLLVRGSLISNEIVSTETLVHETTEQANGQILQLALILGIILIVVIVIILLKKRHKKRQKQGIETEMREQSDLAGGNEDVKDS